MAQQLEDRVTKFTVRVLRLVEGLADNKAVNHLSNQLIRSCTAPPLIYGEATAAESPQDFIHKMGVALKELKETRICLKVIREAQYSPEKDILRGLLNENEQLIAIFGSSINTARKNLRDQK